MTAQTRKVQRKVDDGGGMYCCKQGSGDVRGGRRAGIWRGGEIGGECEGGRGGVVVLSTNSHEATDTTSAFGKKGVGGVTMRLWYKGLGRGGTGTVAGCTKTKVTP